MADERGFTRQFKFAAQFSPDFSKLPRGKVRSFDAARDKPVPLILSDSKWGVGTKSIPVKRARVEVACFLSPRFIYRANFSRFRREIDDVKVRRLDNKLTDFVLARLIYGMLESPVLRDL